MSALVRPDIIQGIHSNDIVISRDGVNLEPEQLVIGPNSIDLHLHPEIKSYNNNILDARSENPTTTMTVPERGMVIFPNVGYLARTVERTYTPKHVPKIGGRSSTGRLFLNIHQTAGFGDVGFDGTWTLEISVIHPVRIYPNMRIAQLWLFETSSDLEEADMYKGRYQGQEVATPYRGHLK